MDRRRDRGPEFTVTFFNRPDFDEDTVRSMFEAFGNLTHVSEKNSRYFIRYREKVQAEAAIEKYGRELGLDFARDRGDRDKQQQDRDKDRKPQDRDGDRRRDRDRDFKSPRKSDDDRRSEVDSRPSLLGPVPAEPSYVERGQRNMSIPLNPPDLLDASTKLPEKFVFILGNLPPKFTQDDVQILVEETKPSHIGKIDATSNPKLNFCPIHLDSLEKVSYLQNKLDNFVVGGNRLIAMEASDLLEEASMAYN